MSVVAIPRFDGILRFSGSLYAYKSFFDILYPSSALEEALRTAVDLIFVLVLWMLSPHSPVHRDQSGGKGR